MDPKTNFKLIIIQTELERFKFLVRSFLRARIKKVRNHDVECREWHANAYFWQIDLHPLHIQSLHSASVDTLQPLLSASECQYLTSHHSLLSTHYSSSFLSQFPASLQRLDDTTGGISMIDKPDEDKAVFVRALRDVGDIYVEGTDRRFEMKRGDVWVVRWSAVRQWAVGSGTGDVELI
jgi:GINS complex subunit 4